MMIKLFKRLFRRKTLVIVVADYQPYDGPQFDFDRDISWGIKRIDPQQITRLIG